MRRKGLMAEQEDAPCTFSDEDFERRYSPEEGAPAAGSGHPRAAAQQTQPLATTMGRSRNRFMRTLLRRRFLSSAN
jgi:hypothetical protein